MKCIKCVECATWNENIGWTCNFEPKIFKEKKIFQTLTHTHTHFQLHSVTKRKVHANCRRNRFDQSKCQIVRNKFKSKTNNTDKKRNTEIPNSKSIICANGVRDNNTVPTSTDTLTHSTMGKWDIIVVFQHKLRTNLCKSRGREERKIDAETHFILEKKNLQKNTYF